MERGWKECSTLVVPYNRMFFRNLTSHLELILEWKQKTVPPRTFARQKKSESLSEIIYAKILEIVTIWCTNKRSSKLIKWIWLVMTLEKTNLGFSHSSRFWENNSTRTQNGICLQRWWVSPFLNIWIKSRWLVNSKNNSKHTTYHSEAPFMIKHVLQEENYISKRIPEKFFELEPPQREIKGLLKNFQEYFSLYEWGLF